MASSYVPTSIARGLIARMQATHERRRISVFSGPPGIGKTTAIDVWRTQQRDEVVVVKVGRQDMRKSMAFQHVLEAVNLAIEKPHYKLSTSQWDLRRKLFASLCQWADLDLESVHRGYYSPSDYPRRTVVFDEAQNLSRQAIEILRFWNDADRCYGPYPVGIIFVGNNEFSLASSANKQSVISAAVADRALYVQSLSYEELSDEDLAAFVRANCETSPDAVAAIVRSFSGPRSVRSLRRVLDLVEDLHDVAGERAVSSALVHEFLRPAT
jgi:hypothetical protein